jgi:hypothetical protein
MSDFTQIIRVTFQGLRRKVDLPCWVEMEIKPTG